MGANKISGFPMTLDMPRLHSIFIDVIAKNIYGPLDIFQGINILSVEKAVVPAYYVNCIGAMTYKYEVAITKEVQRVEKKKGEDVTVTEKVKQWIPQDGSVAETTGAFISANAQFAEVINQIYSNVSPNAIDDALDLDSLSGCVSYANDLVADEAIEKYIKPRLDNILEQKAANAVTGKETRKLEPSSSTVKKNQEIQVFLGFYIIKYEYKDKLYKVYINYDASQTYYSEIPIDNDRLQAIKAKESELSSVKNHTIVFSMGIGVAIVLALFGVGIFIFAHQWWGIPIGVLGLAAAVACVVFMIKKNKTVSAQKGSVKKELDALTAQIPQTAAVFREAMVPFRGCFSNLAGESSAFSEIK